MIPIHESENGWVYPTLVTLSLLGLFLWPTSQAIPPGVRSKYYWLQGITLVSAIVGAKASMLAGDRGWPIVPLTSLRDLVISGRSITGGLAFGFIGAEIAKPLLHYTMPPNDAFAAKLPFSIALGRVGCLFAGCCRGVPHPGFLSVRYDDGVERWPAQLVEILFQLAIGCGFLAIVRRRAMTGRVYALYMVLYGGFRFVTEFMRETPKVLGTLSVYQALSVFLVLLGTGSLLVRSRREAYIGVRA